MTRPIIRRQPQRQIQPVTRRAFGNKLGFVGQSRLRQGRTRFVARGRYQRRRGKYATQLNTGDHLWRSIGMAPPKLHPNRERFDLFDKQLRAEITRNHILRNMQNIGTGLKKAGTVHTMDVTQEIAFPPRISRIFAISIRTSRFMNLLARLGPWERHVTLWSGTNGELLDKNKLVREGVVAQARLKRGEIGCYDSHYRLWRHISDNNIPNALILEDDADIHYAHDTVHKINHMFNELDKHGLGYDVVYFGHNNNRRPKKMFGTSIGTPAATQGLFMYYVTLEGVRKLLKNPIPMREAVDDYVFHQAAHVRQFTLEPRLGYVVTIERSDTANIY